MASNKSSATSPSPEAPIGAKARLALKEVVERHTTLSRLGQDMGRSMQWVWRFVFTSKTFQLEKVEEILRSLNVPLRFYCDLLTRDEPDTGPTYVLDFFREKQLLPRAPFLEAHLEDLRRLAQQRIFAAGYSLSLTDARQRELEALRFRDNDLALRKLEKEMLELNRDCAKETTHARLADLAILLAIWASAQMSQGRRADAGDALVAAFELAEASGNGHALGVCWQRGAYLLADVAQHRYALQFLEKAAVEFGFVGAYERIPGVLIGRGIVRTSLGLLKESIADLKNAKAQLPADDWRLQAMASNGLAVSYELSGEHTKARHALAEAVAAWQVEDLGRAPLLWRQGSFALREGRLEEADNALRSAMIHYEKFGDPLDCALVALDLAHCLVLRRKFDVLRNLGRQVLGWRPLFAGNSMAQAAMIDLACTLERAAAEARIHADALGKLAQTLQSTDYRRRTKQG